ncbi:MAG: hypothetical protein IKM28_03245 [Lachnospiraceae bacterium]|nr:hypothetical protein [Lachnospiraceae bacterium]
MQLLDWKETNLNINTPYDDVFRTLLMDCRQLIIPIINEIFGTNYSGKETVILKENEIFLKYPDSSSKKRITDSSLLISTVQKAAHYHIECQSTSDGSMLIRMYEYGSQIALKDGIYKDGVLEVYFPESAVLYLRHTKHTPDQMTIRIHTSGGSISYDIPTLKVQAYSIEDIFSKNLLFLLPFYIFTFEKQLPRLEADSYQRQQLKKFYADITIKLDRLCYKGELDEYTKKTLCQMSEKVLDSIASKYDAVRKEVREVMGGNILEYEAKTILLRGREEGREEGRKEGQEEAAHRMFEAGFSPQDISNILKIDLEKLNFLKESPK